MPSLGSMETPGGETLSINTGVQRNIVVVMIVMLIVSLAENVASGKGPGNITIILGVFVTGGMLIVLSYMLPNFAMGIAIVALVATIFTRGTIFWDMISRVTGGKLTGAQVGTTPPNVADTTTGVPGGPPAYKSPHK